MGESSLSKWKQFEDVVAHIQRSLAPRARIERNVRIRGQIPGVFREIDLAIRTRVGHYPLLVVVECKDYKHPVNVKHIEAFVSMTRDVGANKGVMVAANGFSAAAKTVATSAGIDLYTVVDTELHTWRSYVTAPSLYDISWIEDTELTLTVKTGTRELAEQLYRELTPSSPFYNRNGEYVTCLANAIADAWEAEKIPHKRGIHDRLPLLKRPHYMKVNKSLYKTIAFARIKVGQKLLFGQHPVTEIKGFKDEITGGTRARTISFAPLSLDLIEADWTPIDSRDQLGVKPLLEIKAHRPFPRVDELI
jgi:hypothetical protein